MHHAPTCKYVRNENEHTQKEERTGLIISVRHRAQVLILCYVFKIIDIIPPPIFLIKIILLIKTLLWINFSHSIGLAIFQYEVKFVLPSEIFHYRRYCISQ